MSYYKNLLSAAAAAPVVNQLLQLECRTITVKCSSEVSVNCSKNEPTVELYYN
jgi:hypothetical protein